MKKYWLSALAVLAGVLASTGTTCLAMQSDDSDQRVIEKPVLADNAEKLVQVATQIRALMGPGGRYEFIPAEDKVRANADLDAMLAMLQKAGAVAAMSMDEKIRLFNTQEHLNGILTHSDRYRLVCQHRPPSGSMVPATSCMTVAEIEKRKRDSQNFMEGVQSKQSVPLMSGPGH